jgi:hypothetical protein
MNYYQEGYRDNPEEEEHKIEIQEELTDFNSMMIKFI